MKAGIEFYFFFRVAELTEQLNAEMPRADELENKYEDVEYDLSKTRLKNERLVILIKFYL